MTNDDIITEIKEKDLKQLQNIINQTFNDNTNDSKI